MKTLIAILVILFSFSSHAAELSDFGWSFDNDIEYVVTSLDKDIKYKIYEFNLWEERKSFGEISHWGFGGIDTRIYAQNNNPRVYIVETKTEKEDSEFYIKKEHFSFCANSGRLLQYRYIESFPKDRALDFFDRQWRLFVGYGEVDTKVLQTIFYSGMVGFDWYEYGDKFKVLRNAFLKKYENNIAVYQTFLNASEEEKYCSSDEYRKIDIKNIKPMGLNKYLFSTHWLIKEYDDKLYMYSQCENFFPELKESFDSHWQEYEEKNTKTYLEAKIKLQKVFAKIKNDKLEKEFYEGLLQSQNSFKKLVLNTSSFLTDEQNKEDHYKSCTGWLTGEVHIFGQDHYNNSVDYVLE